MGPSERGIMWRSEGKCRLRDTPYLKVDVSLGFKEAIKTSDRAEKMALNRISKESESN